MIAEDLKALAVPINKLKPLPGNPRRGDVEAVRRSYERFGQRKPIVAQRDGTVIAGNHQLKAAQALGWSEMAVVWVDDDEQTAKAFALADNRTADLGSYDNDALAELLADVATDPELLLATGYSLADIDYLISDTRPDDVDDVPANVVQRSVVGDVWLLGQHRLVCGDGTNAECVRLATNGAPIDLVVTDPPYGVSYVGGTGLTIMNDNLDSDSLFSLLLTAFANFADLLKPGGPFYVFSPSGQLETIFRLALDKAGLSLRQQLVWVKSSHVLSRQDYHGKHETILYGWSDGLPSIPLTSWDEGLESLDEAHALYDPEHETMLYGWKEGKRHEWNGGRKQNTIWEFDKPARSKEHPTMKPVEMIERAIRNSSTVGDLVFDPFGGSGSTLIASHLSKRVCGTIELDPKYCDVICARFEKATGIKPIAESTGNEHSFLEE